LKKNPNFIPWKKEGKKSLWPFFFFMVIKHVMQAFFIQQLQRFKNSLKNLPTLIPSPSWVRSVNSYYFQARKCLNLDSEPFVLGYDIHNSYHLEAPQKNVGFLLFTTSVGAAGSPQG
jgi:hypothetical protein